MGTERIRALAHCYTKSYVTLACRMLFTSYTL